jgi:hypothetical protein
MYHPPKWDLSWIRLLLDPKPPSSQHIQTWPMTLRAMATIVMARTSSHLHADTIHVSQNFPVRHLNSVSVRGARLIHSSLHPQPTRSFTRTIQRRNLRTAYVANASTVNQGRQRHGDALCSYPGNGCVTLCVVVEKQSVLKMRSQVCNKCGLFERAHAAPRPKAFPRRRRSRSPSGSGYPNTDAPLFNHFEYRHYDDRSFTGHFPSAVGSTCGDTNSQDPTWMTNNVSSTPTRTRLNPTHIVSPQPRTYRAGSHVPFTVPAEAAYPSSGSHLSDRRLPM